MSILEKTHKLCEKFFIFKGGKNSERNYEVWHNKQLLENVLFKFPTQFDKIYARLMTFWLGNWKICVWLYNCLSKNHKGHEIIRLDIK